MLSTFRKVDARQILRREASGALTNTIPASRVAERVFGQRVDPCARSSSQGATYILSCLQSMSRGFIRVSTRLLSSGNVCETLSGRI